MDEGFIAKSYRSALSKADYSRQRDIYVIASRYRNPQCMRLWNDFAAEQPDMARMIAKDAEQQRREENTATHLVDGVLAKAEQAVRGPDLRKKARKSLKRARRLQHETDVLIKSMRPGGPAGPRLPANEREVMVRAELAADLSHPDPARREAARGALGRLDWGPA